MSTHRVFTSLAVVALIVVAALTIRLAAATNEITNSSAEAASLLSSSQGLADRPSAGSVRSVWHVFAPEPAPMPALNPAPKPARAPARPAPARPALAPVRPARPPAPAPGRVTPTPRPPTPPTPPAPSLFGRITSAVSNAVADVRSTVQHVTKDECFDVPFGEIAACHADIRASSQNLAVSTRLFRGKLVECFDVPLSERCGL
jgi:hypothetical protein